MRSSERRGDVYAVLEHPYGELSQALSRASGWCDILFLIVTVKRCDSSGSGAAQELAAYITRKPRDPVDSARRVGLDYRVAAAGPDYLRVSLAAASGPAGMGDYEIGLEAAPLDERRSFIHLSYAYELGFAARLAMDAYLGTSGRDKVGFSVIQRDGRDAPVSGMRGVVERNAMRYYLAVKACLDALSKPPAKRLEARLREWYAGIERYPRQLKEPIGEDEYVAMKRREAAARPGEGDGAALR